MTTRLQSHHILLATLVLVVVGATRPRDDGRRRRSVQAYDQHDVTASELPLIPAPDYGRYEAAARFKPVTRQIAKVPERMLIAMKDVQTAEEFYNMFVAPGMNLTQAPLATDAPATTDRATTQPPKLFRCPSAVGMFADVTDCSKFYHCSISVPYSKSCAKGTLFDAKAGGCRHADRVICEQPQEEIVENVRPSFKDDAMFDDVFADDVGVPGEDVTSGMTSVEMQESFLSRGRVYIGSDAVPLVDSVMTAVAANCEPRLMPVSLPLPEDMSLLYYPPCTTLYQCGGCCGGQDAHQKLLACKPIEMGFVQLKVYKVQYRPGASYYLPVGFEILTMQNHTRCQCTCRKSPEDCTTFQVYRDCQCLCPNIVDANYCTDRQKWDQSQCKCKCPFEEVCPTGQYYNHMSCSAATLAAAMPDNSAWIRLLTLLPAAAHLVKS